MSVIYYEDRTAPRIAPAPGMETVAEGEILADGTEQVLVEAMGLAEYYGLIDLSRMVRGDAVAITTYMRLEPGGEWVRYARMEYAGEQEDPLVHFLVKTAKHGFRVTLQQIWGAPKKFKYAFYRRL